jgi:hypothetical protein
MTAVNDGGLRSAVNDGGHKNRKDNAMEVSQWALAKLEQVKHSPRVLVQDTLQMLPETDSLIDRFARNNGYTVIVASTNLVFRQLYEFAQADPDTQKLLVIDRAPARRREQSSSTKAPPPFYPDLLATTPAEARIMLNIRQFLQEITGDMNWPLLANNWRYARLILRHMPGVLRAHQNLRAAEPQRFLDSDFERIVAFAALGIPESAFKKLNPGDYWKIGLLGHNALTELASLAPEVTRPIKEELRNAVAPFCWFADNDPDLIIRASYLAVILAQHTPDWNLLLANVDPVLAQFAAMDMPKLREAIPELVRLDPAQAKRDVREVEDSLSRDMLHMLLVEHLAVNQSAGFAALVEKEHYSSLLRSLGLLLALDNLLSANPDPAEHARLEKVLDLTADGWMADGGRQTADGGWQTAGGQMSLFDEPYTDGRRQTADHRPQTTDGRPQTTDHGRQTTDHGSPPSTDHRPSSAVRRPRSEDHRPQTTDHRPLSTVRRPRSEDDSQRSAVPSIINDYPVWSDLRHVYSLAVTVQSLGKTLEQEIKTLKVQKDTTLSFAMFREIWNEKRINRLEYFLSDLKRLVESKELLPRHPDKLPSLFDNALTRIQQQVQTMQKSIARLLAELNQRFQNLVALRYPSWVIGHESENTPILTAQFLSHCLQPHWDPAREKAVVLIFDGMRYDIWDEFLRPLLMEHMDMLADLPGCSLLPSETQLTRKAISAGTFPDAFDSRSSEDRLLKEGLARVFAWTEAIDVVAPEGTGTGETVRYRTGNLDVYIFELCDKELHKIGMHTLADGRLEPNRPLAFVYQQTIKNIIDTEVMAIVRRLEPGTRVFVTADHGFGPVVREPLWFEDEHLNDQQDCAYLNCWLRVPIEQARLPYKVRSNIVSFTPQQLRMPTSESFMTRGGQQISKEYQAIVFPRVGYSFRRKGQQYRPDAYTHGGISLQELLIPMVVLQVTPPDEGLVKLDAIEGPDEVVEGEEVTYRIRITRTPQGNALAEEVRVDLSFVVQPDWGRNMSNEEARNTDQRPQPAVNIPSSVAYIGSRGEEVACRFHPATQDATATDRQQGVMHQVLTATISYRDGRRIARATRSRRFTVQLNAEQVIRRVPTNLGNILGMKPKTMR